VALARAAVRGATASWIGALAGFLIRFAVNAALARMILPEIFGEFALASVYSELIGLLAAAGFSNCVIQFDEGPEATVPVALQLSCAVALAIVAGGALAGAYAWFVGRTTGLLVLVLCVGKALVVLSSTYEAVLQRNLQFVVLAKYRVYGVVVSTSAAALLAVLDLPRAALLAREVLAGLIPALAMLQFLRISWAQVFRPNASLRALRKRAFRLGLELFWVQALDTLYQRLDQAVLGWFLGPVELGYYYQAKYIAGLPHAAVTPATQSIALRVFVSVAPDPARLRKVLELLQVSAAHALAIAAIVLTTSGRPLVTVAFSERWAPVADLFPFLAPWILLQPLVHNLQLALTALTRWRAIRLSRVAQLAVLLLTAPLAIPVMGAGGAAAAVSLAIASAMMVLMLGLDREQRPALRSARSILAGAIGAVAVALLLSNFTPCEGWACEVNRTIASLIGYAVCAVAFGGPVLREIFARVAQELRTRKAHTSFK
jgi:O-antigen/teichoic acid export membrane protein